MKHWHRRFPIYDSATIHLVVTDNLPKALLRFKSVAGLSKQSDGCIGYMARCWPNYYILLDERGINKRTLAHEISHAVMYLMRDVGVRCANLNDEAYAYMNDWLTGWAYRRLGEIPTDKPGSPLDKKKKRA